MTSEFLTRAFDRRLTPARPDLAAAYLEGHVKAGRFVTGDRRTIIADVADIKRSPRPDAPLDTQAIHGETVTLFEVDEEGWGWVQLEADGYVGYVAIQAIDVVKAPVTHIVMVNRTFVYPAANMKTPIMAALPIGARVTIDRIDGVFSHVLGGGFLFTSHLAPFDAIETDFVLVAERLLHTPYLWGGKTSLGIDCSGLVQLSLARAGFNVPRDADLQEQAIGVLLDHSVQDLRRGDLVFWSGHVGIMRDAALMIHANAHHMSIAIEPLADAAARIMVATGLGIRGVRRIAA